MQFSNNYWKIWACVAGAHLCENNKNQQNGGSLRNCTRMPSRLVIETGSAIHDSLCRSLTISPLVQMLHHGVNFIWAILGVLALSEKWASHVFHLW